MPARRVRSSATKKRPSATRRVLRAPIKKSASKTKKSSTGISTSPKTIATTRDSLCSRLAAEKNVYQTKVFFEKQSHQELCKLLSKEGLEKLLKHHDAVKRAKAESIEEERALIRKLASDQPRIIQMWKDYVTRLTGAHLSLSDADIRRIESKVKKPVRVDDYWLDLRNMKNKNDIDNVIFNTEFGKFHLEKEKNVINVKLTEGSVEKFMQNVHDVEGIDEFVKRGYQYETFHRVDVFPEQKQN